MRNKSLKLLLVIPLLLSLVSKAQTSDVYSFEKSISVPGDGGYDYLSIDEVNRHLFISHGGSVNVIDLKTEKIIGSIDNMKGVHGIADGVRGFTKIEVEHPMRVGNHGGAPGKYRGRIWRTALCLGNKLVTGRRG